MKKTQIFLLFLLLIVLVLASTSFSHASIISVTDGIQLVSGPASVKVGEYESNEFITLFPEQQDVFLSSDLAVDVIIPSTYGPNTEFNTLPEGKIIAGTSVSSYFLHADPENTKYQSYYGRVTFDREILGLAFLNYLTSTAEILGMVDTEYDSAGLNVANGDQVIWSVSEDGYTTITLDFKTSNLADNVRIITQGGTPSIVPIPGAATVPIPGAVWLFASGLIGLVGIRRRSTGHRESMISSEPKLNTL